MFRSILTKVIIIAVASAMLAEPGAARSRKMAIRVLPSTPVSEQELGPVSAQLLVALQGHYASGDYIYASDLAEKYVTIVEQSVGKKEHFRYTEAIGWLALLYRMQGRLSEAEALSREGRRIDERLFGPDNIRNRVHVDNLAGIYLSRKRFTEAEVNYKRALAIVERALGNKHPAVGGSLNNLAWLYQYQGRFAEAEPLAKRAVAIVESGLGKQDAEVGRALDTLARIYEGQGRAADAGPLYARSLAILEASLGTEHPDVATSRGNLGGLYKALGRLEEAEPLVESALTINESIFGDEHPNIAGSLAQLADLRRSQGQCDKAEPLFLRASKLTGDSLAEVAVLFGTDRKQEPSSRLVSFGGERGGKLAFGLAIVTVPKEKETGSIGDLTAGRAGAPVSGITEARRLAMHCIEVIEDKQIIETAARRLASSRTYPNQALIFVHGYNVSFENALRRTAQIAHDINFDGGVFLFSWPSRGGYMDYLSDRETVDLASANLKAFLENIVTETGATKLHFIAHSMGNMVAMRALESVSRVGIGHRASVGEVIHAAPDVDPDLFVQMAKNVKAAGVTLYASRTDRALWVSSWMRDRPRAGFIKEKPLITAGVDTIDITEAGMGLFALNHDVYSASPAVVADMQRIVESGGRPPDKRTSEYERRTSDGAIYWRLRKK